MRSALARMAIGGVVLIIGATTTQAQLADPIPGSIPASAIQVQLQTVATGLTSPLVLTHAHDGADRLFVVDQDGPIHLIKNGALQNTPYLNTNTLLVNLNPGFDERGLLGLAFHPDFNAADAAGTGKFYTYTSEPTDGAADFPTGDGTVSHQTVIREWSATDSTSDTFAGTNRVVMRIDQPQGNHNGGMIAFGPDGNLYIALGDGGGRDDEGAGHSAQGNAQDASNILGSIVRINPDPNDTAGTLSANGQYRIPDNPFIDDASKLDEIYALGMRNPFRMSFDTDPATGLDTAETSGALIVGDVGQGDIEEVNVITEATAGGNYGWRVKEGTFLFDTGGFVTADSPGVPADLIDPVFQYDHDEGISVIGGFVYRGLAVPELDGLYIFGEFSRGGSGRLFAGDLEAGTFEELLPGDQLSGLRIKGFGRDADGEIYVLASEVTPPTGDTGVVLKIVPEPASLMVWTLAGLIVLRRRP